MEYVGWGEEVGEGACDEAGAGGGEGNDGDVRSGGVRGRGGSGGGIEGTDDGTEVVDKGFAGAGDEEEAGGEEPHCRIAEEAAGFGVEEPGLLASFFFVVRFEGGAVFVGKVVVMAVDCAVAVGFVEDGALEEIAFFEEEAASLHLFDGFVY